MFCLEYFSRKEFLANVTWLFDLNTPLGLVTVPGVQLTTKLTTDVWEQYKLDTSVEVSNNDDFMDNLDKLLDGGDCGAGCAQDVVTCPA